jgi:transketolase
VTLHACLSADDELASAGIGTRVPDLYSVKPLDSRTVIAAVAATGGHLVVAEDRHTEGGLGAAVLDTP